MIRFVSIVTTLIPIIYSDYNNFYIAAENKFQGVMVNSPDDGDLALCGEDILGCISLSFSSSTKDNIEYNDDDISILDNNNEEERGYISTIKLGTLESLGHNRQRWIYDSGLLKAKLFPRLCLSPVMNSGTKFIFGNTYDLTLYPCPNQEEEQQQRQRHMRFLITEDGRIQNLAKVVIENDSNHEEEESITPYCLTIDNNSNDNNNNVATEETAAGSKINLQPCDLSSNDGKVQQQSIQAYGTIKPFVYSLHNTWGNYNTDVIQLAFDVGRNNNIDTQEYDDAEFSIDIYKIIKKDQDDLLLVYSIMISTYTSVGVWTFPVSSLMPSDSSNKNKNKVFLGNYVAKLHFMDDFHNTQVELSTTSFFVDKSTNIGHSQNTNKNGGSISYGDSPINYYGRSTSLATAADAIILIICVTSTLLCTCLLIRNCCLRKDDLYAMDYLSSTLDDKTFAEDDEEDYDALTELEVLRHSFNHDVMEITSNNNNKYKTTGMAEEED